MTRVMYLDCFSGAAGDMLLGALLDAGLPLDALRVALGSLGVDHDVRVSRVVRSGVSATKFDVIARAAGHTHGGGPHSHVHTHGPEGHTHSHGPEAQPHSHTAPGEDGHRTLAEIGELIGQSALSAAGKEKAIALFRRLGEAEAAIHQMSLDAIHLHEVGALDSIIDIVGVVFAMEWFGIDEVIASPLNVGSGTVDIAHGTFPVPAPATVHLLTGVPVYSQGPAMELLTPTGALLVTSYARAYGVMPPMTIARVGYGAGTRDFPGMPNVLRVVIGEQVDDEPRTGPAAITDTVVKIECEIDDMSPQLFGPMSDRVFDAGALDVFLTAVQMKKGRPGTLVTVIAPEARRAAVCDVIFEETTTLGVRFESMSRETLERRWVEVDTPGGPVRIKVSGRGGVVLNAVPEFDDCLRIAEATDRPVRAVQADAVAAWLALPERGLAPGTIE